MRFAATDQQVRYLAAMHSSHDPWSLATAFASVSQWVLFDDLTVLANVNVPTVVTGLENDTTHPLALAKEIAEALPRAELAVVNAGLKLFSDPAMVGRGMLQHSQHMSVFRRRAEWIWRRRGLKKLTFAATTPSYAAEGNLYLHFRKPFDLTTKPSSGVLRLRGWAIPAVREWKSFSGVGRRAAVQPRSASTRTTLPMLYEKDATSSLRSCTPMDARRRGTNSREEITRARSAAAGFSFRWTFSAPKKPVL